MPSAPVAVFAIVLVATLYSMVVPGRPRSLGKVIATVAVAVYAGARLYLGSDHPTDVAVGVVLIVAILVDLSRFFTPNEVFPVKYGPGKTAHLDIGGVRGVALRHAVEDQLGVKVVDASPSAWPAPADRRRCASAWPAIRNLCVREALCDEPRARRPVVQARAHDPVRTPGGRGAVPVGPAPRGVRGLHRPRPARRGIRTAASYGIVELTPEREYLLVTEFFDGAQEIGDAELDEELIDEGLALIRRMWDAGVAHRDIKPANLLVKDGHVIVIDVAFVQVRPSPWRQAVDLANMMLVLAVRSDAETVYRRALRYFSPDEIAEAFAAAAASPARPSCAR